MLYFSYVNSDYVFLSSLRDDLRQVNISYDIACQYSINFFKRAAGFAPNIKKNYQKMKINFGVPKFHLPAHGSACWTKFSLNFLRGWARVDGEEIERTWSGSNSVAASTREMGPGTRHDFLDDLWGAVNFRKICNLGMISF
jgi:hypothetical protein